MGVTLKVSKNHQKRLTFSTIKAGLCTKIIIVKWEEDEDITSNRRIRSISHLKEEPMNTRLTLRGEPVAGVVGLEVDCVLKRAGSWSFGTNGFK